MSHSIKTVNSILKKKYLYYNCLFLFYASHERSHRAGSFLVTLGKFYPYALIKNAKEKYKLSLIILYLKAINKFDHTHIYLSPSLSLFIYIYIYIYVCVCVCVCVWCVFA